MPDFVTVIAFTDQIPTLSPVIRAALRDWVDATPPEAWVVVGLAGVIVFLLGRLSVRKCVRPTRETAVAGDSDRGVELRWRHEKLVLMERQEEERRQRQAELAGEFRHYPAPWVVRMKMGLFHLAEEAREIRQRIGTDHSRLSLVVSRLETISGQSPARPEAIRASLEMAGSQLGRLEEAREQMRAVSQSLSSLAESYRIEAGSGNRERKRLREELIGVQNKLSGMPSDWQVLTDEAERQIRDLLAAGGEPEFRPLCEILLVDGGVTESLGKGSEHSLAPGIEDLLDLLEEEGDEAAVALRPDSEFQPSNGFMAVEESGRLNGHPDSIGGHRSRDDASVHGEEPESRDLVLFRSNDVSLWGKDIYRGGNHRARAVAGMPEWAEWISIRRLDTGEAVFTPVERFSFSSASSPGGFGFNGSYEMFYGARHLGIYSETCPNEVETRFTYGGWGFGHRVSEVDESGESLQASGWAGREIPADTVFEITLHAALSEPGGGDVVLSSAGSVLSHD